MRLTDLVLVDILAALPMRDAFRLARLGNKRLRDMSCRAWVLARVTDVDFPVILAAYQAGGQVREAFYRTSVLKRLYGRVFLSMRDIQHVGLLGKIPGYLHFHFEDHEGYDAEADFFWYRSDFIESLPSHTKEKLKYVTTKETDILDEQVISRFPSLVFEHQEEEDDWNRVYYQPHNLNGRHILDVLLAVYRPQEVPETELLRSRSLTEVYDGNVMRTVFGSSISAFFGK